ncbi:RNA polymerase sigma-70 factor [Aestuariibaculum sp. YM273]|uniref:RNA polymerase sigma factor n=1 Tax=Aestuariibaculum sp. YM273 TaxID=3070659 RepID=UPI0027DDA528|nr:RNA polymerase sigma-70 factor [Aestuariibaculum sp. YM273]WMI64139.1 RNA polymerase sigma-70 factor [Aestuariibaculum sp. YM273]
MKYIDQKALINDIKKGKESAFVFALETYNKRLYAYALTLTNDSAMAQDVVQNVFLKTWEQRSKINIKSSLLNYLFKSVYNEFINEYKKNKALLSLEQKYYNALDKIVSDDDNNFSENAINFIKQEIQNLPPKCREVFILSRKEGLTNIEIANYLNISIKSVEAHIHKAMNVLKERIGSKMNNILFMIFGIKTN